MSAPQTYNRFRTFLGAFPPAAIFIKMGGNGFSIGKERFLAVVLFLIMNAICMLVGWKMGNTLGDGFHRLERSSWSRMVLGVSVMSLVWAGTTGFAGGAIVFIIGGFFGAAMAMPVAVAGFLMFSIIHRLIERGGLIERAHVLPLVFGISMTIGAFILSAK